MKKTLATLALLTASATALASSLSIVGGTSTPINGYDLSPQYTTGIVGGKLLANTAGYLTLTYLGQESGWQNGVGFTNDFTVTATLNGTDTLVALNEFSGMNSSITTYISAPNTTLDFRFRDSQGNWVENDGTSNSQWATFAILPGYGQYDYLLGFNDGVARGDKDYDDYVVGVKLSPVPLPAAVWLFGSALLGFVTLSNRRKV